MFQPKCLHDCSKSGLRIVEDSVDALVWNYIPFTEMTEQISLLIQCITGKQLPVKAIIVIFSPSCFSNLFDFMYFFVAQKILKAVQVPRSMALKIIGTEAFKLQKEGPTIKVDCIV